MKYAYIHTNGNDMVLLPNGTWAAVGRDLTFSEYVSGSAEDRDAWNGSELWEDFAESLQAAADKLVEEGAELVAYYEGDKLSIVDEKRWEERCNFHQVTKNSPPHKKMIVESMRYSGTGEETFVDSWEDGEGWPSESRIEQHNIDGTDYYIIIDTSGSDYGIGVAGVIDVVVDYDDAVNALLATKVPQ